MKNEFSQQIDQVSEDEDTSGGISLGASSFVDHRLNEVVRLRASENHRTIEIALMDQVDRETSQGSVDQEDGEDLIDQERRAGQRGLEKVRDQSSAVINHGERFHDRRFSPMVEVKARRSFAFRRRRRRRGKELREKLLLILADQRVMFQRRIDRQMKILTRRKDLFLLSNPFVLRLPEGFRQVKIRVLT